jgi:hypothetical protein
MNRTAPLALFALLGLPFASFAACGGGSDNLPPSPPPPPPAPSSLASAKPVETTPPPPPPTDTKPPPPPPPAITLAKGDASPDPAAPLPVVKIAAPTKDQVVPGGDKAQSFQVKLDVKNWATATGSQHVHLILDNRPYKAIYDTKAPVMLSELSSGAPLEEGQHVLVAFASRANHESVKTKDAIAITSFWVGRKGGKNDVKTDVAKPMLIYSRPKGEYKGTTANHVLVDFQLANVTLGEGKDHVHIQVSGPGLDKDLTADATQFGPPFFLENLRNGTYKLQVELQNDKNELIPGPWNSTTRTITIDRDAEADPAAAHGGHGAADADAGAPKPAPSAAPSGAPSAKPAPKK